MSVIMMTAGIEWLHFAKFMAIFEVVKHLNYYDELSA
jgi:hypothetical protein